MRVALTGGTGFVGSHVIDHALAAGHDILALTRRDQAPRTGVTWVAGDLEQPATLKRLVEGADAVIHVAGVINAPDAAGFAQGNVAGTLAMLAAATAGGAKRFVHVSSLAAREPKLSLYGASKARSEALVQGSGLDWAIVRPPAVYGPGDRETLELFRMARHRLLIMPPRGRLSLIHVGDLARLLLALADPAAPSGLTIECDDGHPGGYSHREFGRALGAAIGTRPAILAAPAPLLKLAARADRLVRRDKAKLTPDRAAYFSHRDWVANPRLAAPPSLWAPKVDAVRGLKETADWYRAKGWL
ncbi:NAD(P)-dependent oxidoreductase [Sphingomonas lutea]|uniref:NAD(P)-dependent oxidoreductase n=1 Tax=Sphingomonas lutea TaxID=1045317 RepID=A0A7G9SL03_9SPHN|nr:NAD(P)-dependent oxidoreductase [Sphingomonas lutea]